MEAILQIRHLTHTYSIGTPFERDAVRDVSFEVGRGEFLGIIGHTGSGKSTLIQHLNGLLRPTEGQVLLNGKDIWAEPKKIRDVRFRVGLVFQYPEYQLFEETVYKDIAFGPVNQGRQGAELDRCIRDAARLVGLREEHLDKSPFELSGGQKRRAALAGVLAMEPTNPPPDLTPWDVKRSWRISAPITANRERQSCLSVTVWTKSPGTLTGYSS